MASISQLSSGDAQSANRLSLTHSQLEKINSSLSSATDRLQRFLNRATGEGFPADPKAPTSPEPINGIIGAIDKQVATTDALAQALHRLIDSIDGVA